MLEEEYQETHEIEIPSLSSLLKTTYDKNYNDKEKFILSFLNNFESTQKLNEIKPLLELSYQMMYEYYNAKPSTDEENKNKPDITLDDSIQNSWKETLLQILTFGIYKPTSVIQKSFVEKVNKPLASNMQGVELKNKNSIIER